MKKGLTYIAFSVMSVAVMVACQHKYDGPVPATTDTSTNNTSNNTGNNGNDTSNTNNNADTGVCFSRDILPVFVSNCAKAGCHDAITRAEGYQLTDYDNIVKYGIAPGYASSSKIYKEMIRTSGKIMPPAPASPLTKVQTDLIALWINEGAKNTANCGTQCDTNNFAFAADIKPITDKYCKGCHSGPGASGGGIKFETYDDVQSSAKIGELLGVIEHKSGYAPMPPGGVTLKSCEIRQIEKWIDAGMLNN